MFEITPQQWQQLFFAFVTALTAWLTLRSRKDDKPEYAEKRVEATEHGDVDSAQTSAALLLANTSLGFVRDEFENLRKAVKKDITESNAELHDHLRRAIRELNQRFDDRDEKWKNQNERIDRMDTRFTRLEARVDIIDGRSERSAQDIQRLEGQHGS